MPKALRNFQPSLWFQGSICRGVPFPHFCLAVLCCPESILRSSRDSAKIQRAHISLANGDTNWYLSSLEWYSCWLPNEVHGHLLPCLLEGLELSSCKITPLFQSAKLQCAIWRGFYSSLWTWYSFPGGNSGSWIFRWIEMAKTKIILRA